MALSGGASDVALAPLPETVNTGPGGENRQYQHILSVAVSQESRLARYAALRKRPGYDLSDPWLVAGESDLPEGAAAGGRAAASALSRLVLGMPCQLVGSGEVVAYLGQVEQGDMCRVRLASGKVATHAARYLLPMPTRPARQGDWALTVDLKGEQAHLNGRRGMCGLTGLLAGGAAGGERRGLWVMLEPTDAHAAPEMVLLEAQHLVSLPSPPQGSARTPWEARRAPALPGPSAGETVLALVDESRQEERLAVFNPPGKQDDSASDAGSVELSSGSSDEVEVIEDEGVGRGVAGAPFAPAPGDLVGILAAADAGDGAAASAPPGAAPPRRAGRVLRVAGADGVADGTGAAVVRLLGEGALPGRASLELPISALRPLSEEELVLAAVCAGCRRPEPEAELLMCERFGKDCTTCAHLRCLSPPLKSVPEAAWFCQCCGGSSVIAASASQQPAPSEDAAGGAPRKRAKVAESAAGERAASDPKAKARAQGKAAPKAPAAAKQAAKRKAKA